jgi:hypothetical protein
VAQLRQASGWCVPALIISGGTGVEHLQALSACGLPWLAKPLQPARLRAWLVGLQRDGITPPTETSDAHVS